MSRSNKVVGLRRDGAEAGMTDAPSLTHPFTAPVSPDDSGMAARVDDAAPSDPAYDLIPPASARDGVIRAVRYSLHAAGAGWLTLVLWVWAARGFALPPFDALPGAFFTVITPVLLIGLCLAQIARGTPATASRFLDIAGDLRRETEALDQRLGHINVQLDTARASMRDSANALENYGASASANLEAAAQLLGQQVGTSARHAESIAQAGTAMQQQFSQMLDAIPVLEEKALSIGARLTDSGDAIADKIDRLEQKMETLVRLTEEAKSGSLSATQSVNAQLRQLQDATRGAGEELTGMADLTATRIGAALDHARQAMDETGLALDMRMTDLNMLVDRSRSVLGELAQGAQTGLCAVLDDAHARLGALNALVEESSARAADMTQRLASDMASGAQAMDAFEARALSQTQRVRDTLAAIGEETLRVDAALQSGDATAQALIARAQTLIDALDASAQVLEGTHNVALDKMVERLEHSRAMIAAVTPEIEGVHDIADTLFTRAHEAEGLLRGQAERLSGWLKRSESGLTANQQQLRVLDDLLHGADERLNRLTESSGPQLVSALLRIKDAADAAAERAQVALSRAIPDAAAALGEASDVALRDVLGDRVNARIAEVSQVAEQAVMAAQSATDRLMRQMLALTEAGKEASARITAAEQAEQQRETEHFSARSARLIDTLNSAAIDIAKALSNDISDVAWGAYLSGDRGIFTRRAVRLLEPDNARAVADLYRAQPDFAEQVNRYIHDFEAMLRIVLAARDGSALAMTLLSSDVGKLYVVLAQAIERIKP